MRTVRGTLVASVALICMGCQKSDNPAQPLDSVVTISISGPSVCPVFSPNPASAKTNQSVRWTNNTSTTQTVIQDGANTPIVTMSPGQTSSAVTWTTAESVLVYTLGANCNGTGVNLSTIVITVN
jgi:hypothetical protein